MTSHAERPVLRAVPAAAPARPRRGLRQALAARLVRAADAVLSWQERARQRYHLEAMDDRMLKDIGLSRADVEREARGRMTDVR